MKTKTLKSAIKTTQARIYRALGIGRRTWEASIEYNRDVRFSFDGVSDENVVNLVSLAINSAKTVQAVLDEALALYFYRREIVYCEHCSNVLADTAKISVEGDLEIRCVICKKITLRCGKLAK